MENCRDRRRKEYWREITRGGCLWALRWILVAERRAVRLLVAPGLSRLRGSPEETGETLEAEVCNSSASSGERWMCGIYLKLPDDVMSPFLVLVALRSQLEV